MHKSFKLAALAGALSMVIGGSAVAANHDLAFDGWTVSNGQIDERGDGTASVCSGGAYDCSTIAAGLGFKQIQVTAVAGTVGAVAGDSYIMTIVTDQNANTGDTNFFSDVSFVKMKLNVGGGGGTTVNNNENGISARQTITELSGTAGSTASFDSTTDINTGWSVSGTPIVISQSLVDDGDTSIAGDDFRSNFDYTSQNDSDPNSATYGERTGFTLSVDQTAGLASAGDPLSVDDTQVFALREVQGTLSTIAGDVTLSGGTASWVAGDDVKAIWLGQTINLDSVNATTGGLGSSFGYLSFENIDSGVNPTTEFGFAASNAAGAWAWDPNGTFGPAPTLAP